MPVIKLTHSDINEMVRRAVHSVLNESVKEVQGSIMAEKEDVIQEIVDYVSKRWEEIKASGEEPARRSKYTLDDKKGTHFSNKLDTYIVLIPQRLVKNLGTSDVFDINVAIEDYTIPEESLKSFGGAERATQGSSYTSPEYTRFSKTTMKVSKSRVDLYVPSVNGELQVAGFHSTLYHELNHTAGRIGIQKKHQYLGDEELNNLNFFTATNRKGDIPHIATSRAMHPEDDTDVMTRLGRLFGTREDEKLTEQKKEIAYVFYSIWEITERNARAEAIYGELKSMGATRENFKQIYPKTELCRQIEELKTSLDQLEQVETPSKLWQFAGKVMNMNRRGKNLGQSYAPTKRYHEAVKQRFLKRSWELLEMLYRKAMKVAELYFQRQEEREQDKPGGGMERLGQLLGR